MKFLWVENERINDGLCFELDLKTECEQLKVCAVDCYQVFLDGKMVFYGPNRAPAGFIRPSAINVKGVKNIIIKVLSYGKPCYACDFQRPFFGAELSFDGKVIYDAEDFICYRQASRLTDMPRYSRQRGFAEGYDFTDSGLESAVTVLVKEPRILDNGANRASYEEIGFTAHGQGLFTGFSEIKTPWWAKNPAFSAKETDFDMQKDFLSRAIENYNCYDYSLENERTGFIKLSLTARRETEILLVYDEFLPDNKWVFGRGACNDYVYMKIPAGKLEFISAEPYAFKFLKVVSSNEIEIKPALIAFENGFTSSVKVSGNAEIENVFRAAESTFRQNAVDLFTDCPGRERAGWLCDSFFTAKAERLFTGRNDIEKDFINNFLLAKTGEIPKGMLPMCFPSEHDKNFYIPNWAMWFIVELNDYFVRSGDRALIKEAKAKVYGIIGFLDKFLNEFGLLEDLKSWVFLEWSVCNDPEYVKGVNFPSNMLYAFALEKAGQLYSDGALLERAKNMKEQVLSLSFNGDFFADNAIRKKGKLIRCDEHVSETCQYYALFTGLNTNKEYESKIITEFGPMRKDKFPEIGKSNAFIGNYLRLFWLCDIGEYDRVLEESVQYFSSMAEKTGTLWEHDSPKASCCHGFASAIAVLLARCLCGYNGVKNLEPVFDLNFKPSQKYNVKIDFNYNH